MPRVWLRIAKTEREESEGRPPRRAGDVLEVHRVRPNARIDSDEQQIFGFIETEMTDAEIAAFARDDNGIPQKHIDKELLLAAVDTKDKAAVADVYDSRVYVGALAVLKLDHAILTAATKRKADVEAERAGR